jgi:protoporphyrinogen oxidase
MPAPLPEHVDTLIIGAGLAGLSTALHLGPGADAVLVEALPHVGGKACTERIGEFLFDVTGHWLHLRDPGIKALVLGLMGEDAFHRVDRISRIWSHGVYTEYPFQANTHGLPPAVVHECLMGAIEAARARPAGPIAPEQEPENFADWIRFYFGEGIARHFMVPYNARLWGVPATEITSRWCQRFVPKPDLSDIVAGGVGLNALKLGYNAHFLYPKRGGIQTVAEALADAVGRERIHLSTRVTALDLAGRRVTLSDGRVVGFRHLVNTMSLKALLRVVAGVPDDVRAAGDKLRATPVTYFNVGVRGTLGVRDHWVYVPEAEWPIYRVGSFSNAVPSMAPEGHASLYIELADRETPPEALKPRIIEGLVAMGFVERAEQILFMEARRIPDAYVIYDFDYPESRAAVHRWLNAQGVQSIGRYGDWNYSSMEDALIDGRRAAASLGVLREPGA